MAVVMEIDERVLAAKFEAILPHLDERQRRLLLAAEARSLGHGGISLVSRASGVSRVTVTAGIGELEAGLEPTPGRTRQPGGGRKLLTETDPAVAGALDALVEPETRGDPMTRLRWTTKSTRNLAEELTAAGHRVSHRSVGRLLAAAGYSLQSNTKTVEGRQHPDRDAQFRYINDAATARIAAGQPVISVDAKKKEV
jgi:transposase